MYVKNKQTPATRIVYCIMKYIYDFVFATFIFVNFFCVVRRYHTCLACLNARLSLQKTPQFFNSEYSECSKNLKRKMADISTRAS